MTIRFTQKHVEKLQIGDLTGEQFLGVAIETCKVLGWVFSNINQAGFIAHTSNGIFSWNAEVRLKIRSNGSADLKSQSMCNQVIEFGKDKENLQNFISIFNDLKKSLVPEEYTIAFENFRSDVA